MRREIFDYLEIFFRLRHAIYHSLEFEMQGPYIFFFITFMYSRMQKYAGDVTYTFFISKRFISNLPLDDKLLSSFQG